MMSRTTGDITHSAVSTLPELLRAGDLFVLNNTRVFPARLLGRREPSGGAVECLLIGRAESASTSREMDRPDAQVWEALMHPGQKLKPGSRVVFQGAATLHGEVLERHFFGRRSLRLWTSDGRAVDDAIEVIGHVPLPPYIRRGDEESDRDRYQTVYARESGSVAAPTAGLHFDQAILDRLRVKDIETAEITLHVGYGTFQPVRVDEVEDHRLDAERYSISADAALSINRARTDRRRIVAVGTTTTRTLEAVARLHGGTIVAGEGTTDLFIFPGFEFQLIQGLLTNFHLPRSSLLMLVAAFAGRERVLSAYREAIGNRYRFYSYGDAMLIV